MAYLIALLVTTIITCILVPFQKENRKGNVVLVGVLINGLITSYLAYRVLSGEKVELTVSGGYIFGQIAFRIDALSAWFLLIMNFTTLTAILYGKRYLIVYKEKSATITVHLISLVLDQFAMIGIYTIQNTLAFLCVWEIMAISSFMLVIFEHHKMETIKAGINYLIQSHIGIVFLMLGFIWVSQNTGSYDFLAISGYTVKISPAFSFLLFLCFFVAFGIKAGFVPFHTWLPHAHPAAPAHVSGLMSGVIIKLGIYGILRMLLLIHTNYLAVGIFILVISVISALYGVMLAILQHNLKRLLAYHSIENIGIIGIGIGLGTIGKGLQNEVLEFSGYAGALLHTLNHSLFKSLLFYGAGTVYQAVHTINIEKLGGLVKKMPLNAIFFLIASIAICGLPPFNGFISEFLIYSGLFNAINSNQLTMSVLIISSVFGLVLVGGLALFCFTKAFGIVFLGTSRHVNISLVKEDKSYQFLPHILIAAFIMAIGFFPQFFIQWLAQPVSLFTGDIHINPQIVVYSGVMQKISILAWIMLGLAGLIFALKRRFSAEMEVPAVPTWGCGYEGASPKLQYTASSFARSYQSLVKPIIGMRKKDIKLIKLIPQHTSLRTVIHDKIEVKMIDLPLRYLRGFIGRFKFLQNGSVQFYVLYGVVFIAIAIAVPFLINATSFLIALFKQL